MQSPDQYGRLIAPRMGQVLKSVFSVRKNWERMLLLSEWTGRFSSFALAVVISIIWTAAFFFYGARFTPDSCQYLQTASFMFHNGDYNSSLTLWPPLYPFVVHLFMFFTPYPTAAAGLASGFLLFAVLIFFALILNKALRNPALELILFVTLLSFTCFWMPFYTILSEPAFLCFSLANVYFVYQYFDKKKLAFLYLAAVSASCSALTRYTGCTLLLNFLLAAFYLFANESSIKKRIHIGVCAILSLVPSALWALRNYQINETFCGVRRDTGTTTLESIHHYIIHLDRVLSDPLKLLMIVTFVFLGYRLRELFKTRQKASALFALEMYLLGFGLLYSVVLVYSVSHANLNLIGDRLLHPVYPLLILLVGIGLSQARAVVTHGVARTAGTVCCALVLLTGLSINAVSVTREFSKISKVAAGGNRTDAVGFERNPNGIEMARHFHAVLTRHSRVLVATINDKYGYGFFSRRVMWNHPAISSMQIVNLPLPIDERTSEAKTQSFDFDARFNYKRAGKRVMFRGLPKFGNETDLVKKLKPLMEELNVSCAFLIESYTDDADKKGLQLPRKVNVKRLAGGLEITPLFNRQHFAVHQFVFPPKSPSKSPSKPKKK